MAQTFELSILLIFYVSGFSPVRWLIVNAETNQSYCPSVCTCSGYDFTVRADCSGQNLHGIPRDLSSFTVQLDMSVNQILALPDFAFSQYKFLEELRLDGNCLSELSPQVFTGILHLKTLYLQGNLFTEVPSKALEPLSFLQQLHLDANQIRSVPDHAFHHLLYLKQLWLDANELTAVPGEALSSLQALEALTLAVNYIPHIDANTFTNNRKLMIILLHSNEISFIDENAFEGLVLLETMELQNNKLKEIPVALRSLKNLRELDLSGNKIRHIPNGAFLFNRDLKQLHLSDNPILSVGTYSFTRLPYLEKLVIADVKDQTDFPSLQGTASINTLKLSGGKLEQIPGHLCSLIPKLTSLDLQSNNIKHLPNLSGCTQLKILNFAGNEISTLENTPFRNLRKLTDLNLSNNSLTELPFDGFHGLQSLLYLELQNNNLNYIDRDSFGSLSSLQDLNLANNHIPSLPTKGLENLISLKVDQNYEMREFPSAVHFPNVQSVKASYTYHCCHFLNEENFLLSADSYVPSSDNWTDSIYSFTPDLKPVLGHQDRNRRSLGSSRKVPVQCIPEPGPLMPCNNLMEWWSLRVGVWLIFLSGAMGCACVILVLVARKRKMDTNRFLVCNLSWGNLCVAVYLGLLTSVDTSTMGKFEFNAIGWQYGLGCQATGFLAVFGSELSVLILLLITIERVYATKYSGDLQKRLPLRLAAWLTSVAWVIALTFATLPLIDISSYSKYAICLPMDTEGFVSKAYVCALIGVNGAVFLVMIACYIWICVSLQGRALISLHDSRVTKRMAVLIFIDFICWLPIIVLALAAAGFHLVLIGATAAKVIALFVFPLSCCANPLLYITLSRQFRTDCVSVCDTKRNHYTDTAGPYVRANKACNLLDYVEDPTNATRLEADSMMKMKVSCFREISDGDNVQVTDFDEDSGLDDDLQQCRDFNMGNMRSDSLKRTRIKSFNSARSDKLFKNNKYNISPVSRYFKETIPLKGMNLSQSTFSEGDLWERRPTLSPTGSLGIDRYYDNCWPKNSEMRLNQYGSKNKDEQYYVPMLDSSGMPNLGVSPHYLNLPKEETKLDSLSKKMCNVSMCGDQTPECSSTRGSPVNQFNVGKYSPRRQHTLSSNYLQYDPEQTEMQDKISPLQPPAKPSSRHYLNVSKYALTSQSSGEDDAISSSGSSVALQRDSGYSRSGSRCDSLDSWSNTEMESPHQQEKEIIVDCCSTI